MQPHQDRQLSCSSESLHPAPPGNCFQHWETHHQLNKLHQYCLSATVTWPASSWGADRDAQGKRSSQQCYQIAPRSCQALPANAIFKLRFEFLRTLCRFPDQQRYTLSPPCSKLCKVLLPSWAALARRTNWLKSETLFRSPFLICRHTLHF